MLENRTESERKRIFWILLIGTGLIIFFIWLILLIKGFVLDSVKLAETKKQDAVQQNTNSFGDQFKEAINGFKKLDVQGKILNIKDGIKNLNINENIENNNLNQNEEQALNSNENVNQEQVQVNEQEKTEEPVSQENPENLNQEENLNTPSIPRLPVENE
ncbi:MAG: hypothetical protein WC663_00145 [Patescibacteria group bacterium]|jgi:hypothetical protein